MNNIINPLNNQSFTARLDISKVRGSKERWTNIAKMFAENTKDYGDELILSGSFKSGLEVTCKPSENLVVKYFLGKDASNVLKNKVDGVIEVNGELTKQINNIEDVSLRELAMLEATKDNNVNFDTILIRAQNKYDELLGKKQQEVITGYKEELAKKCIDSDVIKDTDSIDEATNKYNEALIDESVRKEILTIIVKTIRKRGFIVNKNNIKLDKHLNLVRLVALKASGQKAEFEIQLNGKFMYRFDNYEGQACKKDITPFIEDLKNIYDINILHEEVIWENPDKIQMQKYQHVNTNKGNN